jgi:hypothetical protein
MIPEEMQAPLVTEVMGHRLTAMILMVSIPKETAEERRQVPLSQCHHPLLLPSRKLLQTLPPPSLRTKAKLIVLQAQGPAHRTVPSNVREERYRSVLEGERLRGLL